MKNFEVELLAHMQAYLDQAKQFKGLRIKTNDSGYHVEDLSGQPLTDVSVLAELSAAKHHAEILLGIRATDACDLSSDTSSKTSLR